MSSRVRPSVCGLLVSAALIGWSHSSPASAQSCRSVLIEDGQGEFVGIEICDDPPPPAAETAEPDKPEEAPRPAAVREVKGGGNGQPTSCGWTPGIEGMSGEVMPGRLERTGPDGSVQVLHFNDCQNDWEWLAEAAPAAAAAPGAPPPPPPPPPTPQDLIPSAMAQVEEQLPTPVLRINPADGDQYGYAYVTIETYFWVDQAVGQWAPVSATASLRGLSLTLTATPQQLEVSTGDGNVVVCEGAPPAYPAWNPDDFPEGCGHTYRDSSAMADNGQTFPVSGTILWSTAWTASTGQSGTLDTLTTTSDVRDLPVAEIQAILVPDP